MKSDRQRRFDRDAVDWGVDTIFGLPGDGINGIMEALRKRQDQIRFIQVRHEEAAAFMACAYAKYTGQARRAAWPPRARAASTCSTASTTPSWTASRCWRSPGITYHDLIDTLHAAGCRARQALHGCRRLQRRASWARRMSRTSPTSPAARRSRYRGVAHITFPVDSRSMTVEASSARSATCRITPPTSVRAARAHARREDDLRQAAEMLNAGKKVAILAGRGALDAGDELEQIAEMLGAPIVKALLGKACVPDDSPYTTGGIGLLGTKPSQEALEECDTLLMVGTLVPLHRVLSQARPGARRADRPRSRRASACATRSRSAWSATAGARCRRCCRCSSARRTAASWRRRRKGMKDWWRADGGARHAHGHADEAAGGRAGSWASACATTRSSPRDSGTITTWFARHIPVKRGQMFSLLGQPGDDGQRPALRHRRAGRLSRPAVRRVRRRRRLLDADGASSPPP